MFPASSRGRLSGRPLTQAVPTCLALPRAHPPAQHEDHQHRAPANTASALWHQLSVQLFPDPAALTGFDLRNFTISSNILSASSRFDIRSNSISPPALVRIVAMFVSELNPAPSLVMSFATTMSRSFLPILIFA